MVQVPRKVSDKRNKSKVTRRQRATEPTAQRKFLRTGWDPVLFALRRAERFLGNMLDVPLLWETLLKMCHPKPTPCSTRQRNLYQIFRSCGGEHPLHHLSKVYVSFQQFAELEIQPEQRPRTEDFFYQRECRQALKFRYARKLARSRA